MRTTIIADAIFPYSEKTLLSEEAASLAKDFKRCGHQVSLITPFSQDIDVAAHSLARRLMPIKVDIDGRTVTCTRFDGRTPDGVELLFLDVGKEKVDDIFPEAACMLIESFTDAPDVCIAIGSGAHMVTRTCKAASSGAKDIVQIARLSGGTVDEPGAQNAADAADRLAFCSHRLVEKWRQRLESVDRRVEEGSAVVIQKPVTPVVSNPDKHSRKTAFQLANKLPVRDDVPLVLVPHPPEDALQDMLSQDIQIAVVAKSNRLDNLLQQYGDRLIRIDDTALDDALASADAVLSGSDLGWYHRALANGALPIVDDTMARDAVDIEPSLETGSAIIAGPGGPQLKAGLGRLLGGFKQPEAFGKLARRLPTFVDSREKTVSHYIQLIEELKLEN